MPARVIIKLRAGTAVGWGDKNPTLGLGELGVESDTKKIKIGDGNSAWNSLSYTVDAVFTAALLAKLNGVGDGAQVNATISTQGEMEALTETQPRIFSPAHLGAAIASYMSTYRTWVEHDFLTGLPSGFTHSRGTTAYLKDENGTWQLISSNAPFIGPKGIHVIPAITSVITTTPLAGAVVGTVGSGGSLPTGWATLNSGQFTWEVLEILTLHGLPAIKLRVHGTLTSGSNVKPGIVSTDSLTTAVNDIETVRCVIKAEPTSSGGAMGVNRVSTGSFDAKSWSAIGGSEQDVNYTFVSTNTNARRFAIYFNVKSIGDVLDATFTLAAPQLYKIAQAPEIFLVGSGAQSSNAEVVTWSSPPSAPFTTVFDVYPCSLSGSVTQTVVEFYADSSNYLRVTRDASRRVSAQMVIGGSVVDSISPTMPAYDKTLSKIGVTVRSNGFSISVNGQTAVASANSMTVPTFTSARIGDTQAGSQSWWGYHKSISVANAVVNDSVLPLYTAQPGQNDFLLGLNFSTAEFGTVPGTINVSYAYPYFSNFPTGEYLLDKGYKIVRIPFRWERIQKTLGAALDATELAELSKVVNDVRSKGAIALLDVHNYGSYRISGTSYKIGTSQVTQSHFVDLWTRLAQTFSNDEKIWFGLMNEPAEMSGDTWWAAAQAATNAIRALGARNMITVPGISWTGAHSWVSSGNSVWALSHVDPGLHCFEVHQYFDSDSSGTTSTAVSETIGVERIQGFQDWCIENGKKGFMGEFGFGSDATSIACANNFINEMQGHTNVWVGCTAWGAGPWWYPAYIFLIGLKDGLDTAQEDALEAFL